MIVIPAICLAAACTTYRSRRRKFGSSARDNLELLGELLARNYQTLLPHSFELEAFGIRFKCIDLPTLIRIKEAAGRRKDLEAIAELRVLLEEIDKKQT